MVSTSQCLTGAAAGHGWQWVAWSVRSGAGARAMPAGYWMRPTVDGLAAILVPAPPRSITGA